MSKLKNELKDNILRWIANNSNIDRHIKEIVQRGIRQSIPAGLDLEDSYEKPSDIPEDSIMNTKQKEFEPLSRLTILRRIVYRKLGIGTEKARNKMEQVVFDNTKVTKTYDGKRIKINISNTSPLLTFLRSGFDGDLAYGGTPAIENEIKLLLDLGEKGDDGVMFKDKDVQEYYMMLTDRSPANFGKIPVRDLLRASCELIGRDFISFFILYK